MQPREASEELRAGPEQHHRECHPAGAVRPAVAGPLAAADLAHSAAAGSTCKTLLRLPYACLPQVAPDKGACNVTFLGLTFCIWQLEHLTMQCFQNIRLDGCEAPAQPRCATSVIQLLPHGSWLGIIHKRVAGGPGGQSGAVQAGRGGAEGAASCRACTCSCSCSRERERYRRR